LKYFYFFNNGHIRRISKTQSLNPETFRPVMNEISHLHFSIKDKKRFSFQVWLFIVPPMNFTEIPQNGSFRLYFKLTKTLCAFFSLGEEIAGGEVNIIYAIVNTKWN
jgi:hypothetical protein